MLLIIARFVITFFKMLIYLYSLALIKCVLAPPLVEPVSNSSLFDFWFIRLLANVLGYATVAIPAFLIVRYLRKIKYNEKGSGFCYPVVQSCVFGTDVPTSPTSSTDEDSRSFSKRIPRTFLLLFSFAGLQVAYLTWGVIQERIMTKEFGKTDEYPGEKFTNSQFLVFVNRLLAFSVAGLYVALKRESSHGCPLYKFSFASFSNIMSSWFQYEALKFVTFPTQVLGKACKVIPVMLMGKVVSGNVYQLYEWLTAGMLSVGISLFLFDGNAEKSAVSSSALMDGSYSSLVGSMSGLILMIGYMTFDSFTSNWQGELFKTYKMSSIQMMFGVNMFSCIFTSCSLLEQGGFYEAFAFMMKYWDFAVLNVILSICSAFGQLFIFFTISEFGAVVFTIIMTLRQAFAILLSCLIYGHPIGWLGLLGVLVVFAALFLRIYARSKTSSRKPTPKAEASATKI